ncbi:C-C motif chemokine 2-like isoform 1-T1 [Rhynchonycteris naso]
MKVSAAFLCLLLTVATFSPQLLAQPDAVSSRLTCCYDFVKKIPKSKLASYRIIISSKCPKEAVILLTKRNQEYCANPSEKWVLDSMEFLNQRNQTAKP